MNHVTHPLRRSLIAGIIVFCAGTPAAAQTALHASALDNASALSVGSALPAHDPLRNHLRDIELKLASDSVYAAWDGVSYRYLKTSYRSRIGDLDIPVYVYRPLDGAPDHSRPALVWVHGGVHGNWGANYLPFVQEAVRRGYVVVAPDYRGSTGYGGEFHDAIDYGGHEVDDVVTAYDFLVESYPEVDPARVAIMGWSHGGFIASHAVFRDVHPFRAGVAIVPVTNLILRLAYKGPEYQALFSTQERIRALPHERTALYRSRSPLYQVDGLEVPLMVQVATNDADVSFIESEPFIDALRARKPMLAETYIYHDPPGGHSFCCLVDQGLQRMDTPAMVDSWRKTWGFLESHLSD